MHQSRPSLWPSLASDSTKNDEKEQNVGYICDYSRCSYLPIYDVHPTNTYAMDDTHWRAANSGQSNMCGSSNLRVSCESWNRATDSHIDVQSSNGFLPYRSTDCCNLDTICFTYGDDLIWRDPNETSKRFERDSGVALWGDPDAANARPVRNWLVGEGEEEDLETAMVSQTIFPSNDGETDIQNQERGDSPREWPFPFPKPIAKNRIPSGWTELPSRERQWSIQRSASTKTATPQSSEPPDVLEYSQNSQPFTQSNRLSPTAAHFISQLHALIPGLRAAEMDLLRVQSGTLILTCSEKQINYLSLLNALLLRAALPNSIVIKGSETQKVNLVKDGTIPEELIARCMSQEQKIELDRLEIRVAAVRVEVANLSKRIQANTRNTDIPNERLTLKEQPIYDLSFPL
ncbi:hypothetical protein RB195_010651 [Necator americanus]|uniref:Uncharacterized protein n=1 Tax=Necator americanus TaxID=51031 RepID=A0ABR1CYW5_NECAM